MERIKELILSESYDDNKLAVNILRYNKNWSNHQVSKCIISTIEDYVKDSRQLYYLSKYFDIDCLDRFHTFEISPFKLPVENFLIL